MNEIGHRTKICKKCGIVISQCRCIKCDKKKIYSICEKCKELVRRQEMNKNDAKENRAWTRGFICAMEILSSVKGLNKKELYIFFEKAGFTNKKDFMEPFEGAGKEMNEWETNFTNEVFGE